MRSGVISRGHILAAIGVLLAAVGGLRALGPTSTSAQTEVIDADLERASTRTIRIGSLSNNKLIATVPIEVYVSQVLSAEADPMAPDVAQQALAVAIRTYALVEARHQRDGYDVCDTTHCQVFRAATEKTRRAALATAGRILTFNRAPAAVFYSASCGGRSESAADMWPGTNFPYLQSLEDDVHAEDPDWTLERTLTDIQKALERAGITGKRLTDVQIDGRTGSGRVARLRVIGLDPDIITGDQFRMAIGPRDLRSTAFSFTRENDRLRFTGRGYGHGVGLCAVGSGRRAARGESLEAILAHYYPGLELESLIPDPRSPIPDPGSRIPDPRSPIPDPRSAKRITARVPHGSSITTADLERMTESAYATLSARLGVSGAPISIELHQSMDDFRVATGQPWWVSSVAGGADIELAPTAILAQRDGLEVTLRRAVAELLMADAFAKRPAWVRVGAARYFARAIPIDVGRTREHCPSDDELTRAVSAVAQREAEARAEACFARAFARTGDWRTVR
jgi:SpoIID/LytB domain protein